MTPTEQMKAVLARTAEEETIEEQTARTRPRVDDPRRVAADAPKWTDEQIRREYRPLWRMSSDGTWHPLNDAAKQRKLCL